MFNWVTFHPIQISKSQIRSLELGGITGRVWNNDDGTVEILAQAESSSIMAKFIQEIRKGPTPFSKVTYLDVQMSNFPSYSDFKVAN